ncbi:hypothetical protein [Mycobacterium intracellulare]|uniref:hypothetical protein n=1 Tax=Mycobacterium intracellulare TaxID=1767 RepID=UPI00080B5286|nr:hypothetical protein [Mycobacterium intracellulare]OCB11758.1 hypothetical protein A5644_03455 [Mycobacterium intracellulare subsp. yongonense]
MTPPAIDDQLSALTDVAAMAVAPTQAPPDQIIVDDAMAARQTRPAIERLDEIPAPDGSAYS